MYKQLECKGNFDIEVGYGNGILLVKKLSNESVEKAMKHGYKGTIMLDATYRIFDGVLYLKGEVVSYHTTAGGSYEDRDFDNQEKVNDYIKVLSIGEEHIHTTKHKKLFGEEYTKTVIDRGHYLFKKGMIKEYKTSLFRIIEA